MKPNTSEIAYLQKLPYKPYMDVYKMEKWNA